MPLTGEEQGQRPKCDEHMSPGPAKRLKQSDLGDSSGRWVWETAGGRVLQWWGKSCD